MRFVIVILAAFALLLAGCASAPQQQASTPPASVPPAPESTVTPPAAQTLPPVAPGDGITPELLAPHSTVDDCWVGYKGNVYDISMFIPNHKNYEALLVPLCGTSDQFEQKFEGKHGMSKVSILEGQPLMGTLGQ